MPFVSYDPNTPGDNKKISGRFTKESFAQAKSQNYLEVTSTEFENITNDPNNYSVLVESGSDPKLVANQHSINNFTKVKAITEDKKKSKAAIAGTLVFGDYEYDPNPAFQQNLSMALAIMAHDKKYVTRFWCRLATDKKWVFLEHDAKMCAGVAKAFSERREQQSEELYKNL